MKDQKKYTVITGASSGIGRETAMAFAGRGKNLIVIARRKERLHDLQSEVSKVDPTVEVVTRICDLSILQNAYRLYEDLAAYPIETWINNAGVGSYGSVATQKMDKLESLLRLNVEAVSVLSCLYARDYKDVQGAQLINISSRGGYVIVPNAVAYCATKFFVSAFTEGLAHELKAAGAKLQAKVLAPAATETEFGRIANNVSEYDYDKRFEKYHTSKQMAAFLLRLYDSHYTVGTVDRETFAFRLEDGLFAYAGSSGRNQKQ